MESVASALPSASAPETFSLFLLELLLCAAATITQRKGDRRTATAFLCLLNYLLYCMLSNMESITEVDAIN